MTYRPSRTAVLAVFLALGLPVAAWLLFPDLREAAQRAIGILTTADIDAAIAALIDYLRSFGIWAPVVSAALMILQSVAAPIPAFLLTFANGMIFGWFWGAALSWTSAMAGAALCFWLARVLGRPAVERLAGGSAVLSTTDRFFERFGVHSILVARLHDWLVTMRKKNAVVMMLTQTPTHLTRVKVGQIIAESVVTQLLYPNPRANSEDYRILRLNEKEAEFLCTPTGGLRLALLRSAGDSVFVNMDLAALGPALAVLGGGRSGEDRAPYGWRDTPDFWKDMT